ncbi:MAG: anhydro-N-acetylmuramic acid kinase [Trueperaceae bacterium]|nr:anhydro-N-acetylmuramic acid kinase [Trueperaceae bacterium]
MTDFAPLTVLSLMSGTSADGIDAVLAQFEWKNGQLSWEVQGRSSTNYPDSLRQRILACMKPESSSIVLTTQVHTEVGLAYARVVKTMQESYAFDLVALSGQTVYHIPRLDPAMNWQTVSTLQLGEAAIVAEHCHLTVVSDFRQSDMAAGGQGAPMVPFGDFMMFSEPGKAKAIHNLGGISNLTYLPASGKREDVVAFDTGPANCLIDEAVKRDFGLEYDANGELASLGKVDDSLLAELMQHPYLSLGIPKTTGREVFTLSEIEKHYTLKSLSPHDLIATLTAFSAQSIAKAYQDFVLGKGLDEIVLAGGGALNPTLISMLKKSLNVPIKTFEALGYNSKDREALAFGIMAYFAFHGAANTLPSATGAKRAVSAGKISQV